MCIAIAIWLAASGETPPPQDATEARPPGIDSDRARRVEARIADEASERERLISGQQIASPSESEPEGVLLRLLVAAGDANAERGFAVASSVMHTSVTRDARKLETLRRYNFEVLRRRAFAYLQDTDGRPSYRLMEKREESDGSVRLFVKATDSDIPTPFRISRDASADGEWRLLSF
jgi:hypothetical protein